MESYFFLSGCVVKLIRSCRAEPCLRILTQTPPPMGRTHRNCVQCIMHVCKSMQCCSRSTATRSCCLLHRFQTRKSSIFEWILTVSNEGRGWSLTWVYAKLKAQATVLHECLLLLLDWNVILQLFFIKRSLILMQFIVLLGEMFALLFPSHSYS